MKVKYKFRFYPTQEQAATLGRTFGCVRFVYNWGLRLRSDAFHAGEKLGYHQSSARLTMLKKETDTAWLKEVSCIPLQQTLRHLNTAYINFFDKRSAYPSFKCKRGKQSAEYTSKGFKWDSRNKNLTISKIGRLRIRWSRSFQSVPTTVTITKTPGGKYFVTLTLDETIHPLPKTGKDVGIDLGINRLATLSDGNRISNPRHIRAKEAKLKKAQRILSRRVKGSGRWNRQRMNVASIQECIANARKDNLDKITTDLVRRFDFLAMEDLNVRGMEKNHRLAKHIHDASWGMFARMLAYKASWYGKNMVKVDRFFPSSKRCSACGYINRAMPLSVRQWVCPECKTEHDRDENAARNILAEGHSVTARGETTRPVLASAKKGRSRRNVNRSKRV